MAESPKTTVAEDSLKQLFQKLYLQESDQEKISVNKDILEYFSQVLSDRESFQFTFESLDMIGKLIAPDRSFKIFTWNIPMEGFTNEYHGLIQRAGRKMEECQVFRLSNETRLDKGMLDNSYTHEQWPGALYYEVLRNKHGGNVFYTLLGFHFNDRFSDMKIIEILTFNKEGKPIFGKPVFNTPEGKLHHVLFEYSGEAVFSLHYNSKLKMIIFDHLSPIEPELAGHPRFYVPDLSYDGYKFHKGFWEFQEDLDVRNR